MYVTVLNCLLLAGAMLLPVSCEWTRVNKCDIDMGHGVLNKWIEQTSRTTFKTNAFVKLNDTATFVININIVVIEMNSLKSMNTTFM